MKLTITWEIPPGMSAERAAALAEKWTAGKIAPDGSHRLPRPIRITVTGGRRPAPQPPDAAPARKLADRRRALGLTQGQLARRARLSQATVSDVELGRSSPSGRAAQAVRRALDALEAGQ